MKYSVKDITLIGLVAALTVVVGYVFYLAGSLFPVPGYKFVVFAPFLSFMMYIPVRKIRKMGVMTIVNLVFGLLMSMVSLIMSIAIISAGITAELVAWLIFRNYETEKKSILAVAIYPVSAVLCASAASNYFTGNAIYRLSGGWKFLIGLSVLIYLLGVFGAYMSNKVVYKRIEEMKES
ncbi:MptD family putative ECF transporter S component [Alkalibacter mobilis]|uniref:MptD family putative ECF transporter S component n=1 Tax=Alkalibacter mobilis TaxID=2787712 RepID=UPI00189E2041|nr:MptD family putative ECF transporter S component [Alkalibacter mobilis]MBF7095508.1 MptD family putative ECF transporter S component [Alkalibacter mobilis]